MITATKLSEDTPLDHTPHLEQTLQRILDVIERTDGDSDAFAETLRRERIPHISFSQVSCVESCRQRYYLQYVLGQDPDPLPDYFTKGKLFHNLLACYYRENGHTSSGEDPTAAAFSAITGQTSEAARAHLENAYRVHLQHAWRDGQVIAVEKPFAMLVDPGLPPVVGVIDLVLQRDGATIIIDHKTGRDFYPQDELQGAIYAEYIRREYGETRSTFYYDHYRWVNNLHRIRKPALQRTPLTFLPGAWPVALERIRRAQQLIEQISRDGWGIRNGQCFRCPYRGLCRTSAW